MRGIEQRRRDKRIRAPTSASSSVHPCGSSERERERERRGSWKEAEDSNEREREEKRRPNITCVVNIDVKKKKKKRKIFFFSTHFPHRRVSCVHLVLAPKMFHGRSERAARRREKRRGGGGGGLEECAQFFNAFRLSISPHLVFGSLSFPSSPVCLSVCLSYIPTRALSPSQKVKNRTDHT